MKSKLVILLFSIICVTIIFNEDKLHHNQYTSDKLGYYIDLPAIFIYHDIQKMSFTTRLEKAYDNTLQIKQFLYPASGNVINKYAIGSACFELPGFILADWVCRNSNIYVRDGLSIPYQISGIASNIFFVIIGLLVLMNFLRRYYEDDVVAITLICIAFGTNLYAYSSFEIGMSHPYSFFLFCCLINIVDNIYTANQQNARRSDFIKLGLIMGLIVIVRPINAISFILPIFWKVDGLIASKSRIRCFKTNYFSVLLALVSVCLILLIQLVYWKYVTGHWIYYSYKNEGFDFLHPNILNGLFSFRKGWFVYTPMAMLCFVGFYYLHKKDKTIILSMVVYFLLMIYATFSWHQWWYGGSFGCRPLIESLAFLALPLGAIIEKLNQNPANIKTIIVSSLITFFITLNIFQTYQYSMGLIHWSRMTKAYYVRVFGKVEFDRTKNEYLLIPDQEEFIE